MREHTAFIELKIAGTNPLLVSYQATYCKAWRLWAADIHSTGKEIHCLIRIQIVHCCVQIKPQMDPILSLIYPVYSPMYMTFQLTFFLSVSRSRPPLWSSGQSSCEVRTEFIKVMYKNVDGLCGLVVRVPAYWTEMYCVSCEVLTEFIYVM
jgi:hypothetical protein